MLSSTPFCLRRIYKYQNTTERCLPIQVLVLIYAPKYSFNSYSARARPIHSFCSFSIYLSLFIPFSLAFVRNDRVFAPSSCTRLSELFALWRCWRWVALCVSFLTDFVSLSSSSSSSSFTPQKFESSSRTKRKLWISETTGDCVLSVFIFLLSTIHWLFASHSLCEKAFEGLTLEWFHFTFLAFLALSLSLSLTRSLLTFPVWASILLSRQFAHLSSSLWTALINLLELLALTLTHVLEDKQNRRKSKVEIQCLCAIAWPQPLTFYVTLSLPKSFPSFLPLSFTLSLC